MIEIMALDTFCERLIGVDVKFSVEFFEEKMVEFPYFLSLEIRQLFE